MTEMLLLGVTYVKELMHRAQTAESPILPRAYKLSWELISIKFWSHGKGSRRTKRLGGC
jgi:hypothetical protein